MNKPEKNIFVEKYGIVNISIATVCVICLIINSIIISESSSAGIFGMIGIVCVMKWKKDIVCSENLERGEFIYIIVFSILSLLLGLESFVTHFVAFAIGVILGMVIQRRQCVDI